VLDDTNRSAWQAAIAYVPQEIFLFDTSLAENIAFGVPVEHIDRERLAAAIRLTGLEKLVEDLPRGYEELLGERGLRLSGGQRQRVGIARALYRESSLLILDEATNELDGLVEQELLAALDSLRGKCTIVLIAHRLSTARHCDMIFEFENGRVSGGGSYEQQIHRSARLRRIAELSA
jgi:ATP-binding cassette subfamily B protein